MSAKVTNNTRKERAQARRNRLSELSEAARKIRKKYGPEDATLNSIIIDQFYTDAENQTFETLKEWNRQGYRVIRGSEAFVIWARPKKIEDTEQRPANSDTEEEQEEKEYFPMAYLFSNAQVRKEEE